MGFGSGNDGEAGASSSHKEEIKLVSSKSEASARDASVVIDVDRVGRSFEGAEDTCRVNEEEDKMCRVCHLASDCTSQAGVLIQLGCSCKNDLGTAHRFCAERWFATKGNRYCEICGAVAENVTIVGSRSFMLEINGVQSSVFTSRFIARYGPLCNYLGALLVVALLMHWFFHVRLVRELILHPEVMHKVQIEIRKALGAKTKIEENDINELHYLHNVIKETLRLHPPLPLHLPRTCIEPTSLLGFEIPRRARVVVNVWAIARDSKIWENPDGFYPERFDESTHDFRGTNYEYIPFGAGRRICPGMTFAMAGMELFISLLLLHFDWEIPGGKGPMELDMEEEFDGTVRRKKYLYLIASTHSL